MSCTFSFLIIVMFWLPFIVSLFVRVCSFRFTPDFTSSWVIRDLTLVTSRGTSFPFTLNVTLPHHMLPLCAQVVPGPSWEDSFWVVTLIFTWLVLWIVRMFAIPTTDVKRLHAFPSSFSLFGVCLMAFRQAQYILREFSAPSIRSNHNFVLSRENGTINNITPNGVKYVQCCHFM